MEYKAEDFVSFIENGRRDKISPNALDLIAKRFRELEKQLVEVNVKSEQNYNGQNAQLPIIDTRTWDEFWEGAEY